MVGQPQRVGKLFFHLAEDTHPEPGPGKRMAVNHFARNPEFDPDLAHFVLEQFAQRFDQVEFHVLRQAADIVMRFNQMRLAGGGAGGFDNIRINRALGQPPGIVELSRLFFEDFDKQIADGLALILGIGLALEFCQKSVFGVDTKHAHAHMLGELLHHLVALAITQQTGVDENTGQLNADRPVQQGRDHRRIDPAGQPQHDIIPPDPRAHLANRRVDNIGRGPGRCAAANLVQETRIDRRALARMRHLGMKLQTIDFTGFIDHAGNRRALGARHQLESGRQLGNPVAV